MTYQPPCPVCGKEWDHHCIVMPEQSERPEETLNLSINSFEKLAQTDVRKLSTYLSSKDLSAGTRTLVAEAIGKSNDSDAVREILLPLLCVAEPIVQEGAIYGLEHHLNETVRMRLRVLIDDKATHWAIKIAAEDALEEDDNER